MKEGFFRKYFIKNLNWIIPGLWSAIEVIDYFFQESAIAELLRSRIVFGVLSLLFLIYIGYVIYIKVRCIELKMTNNCIIQISSKDIASYFKEKDIAFAFSSSNFFNTKPNIVGKELISKYLKKTDLIQDEIQSQILTSLGSAKYTLIENEKVTLDGNKKSYKSGSIASFKNKDKTQIVYLLAITRIKEDGDSYSANCNKGDIQAALKNVWREVTARERVDTICLPAIGSGLAKAYVDANSAVLEICNSFISYSVTTHTKICKKLIVTCNNREFDKESIVSALKILHQELNVI